MTPHLEWEARNTGHTCQCVITEQHHDHECQHCGLVLTGEQFEQMRKRFPVITDEQHDEMVSRYGGRN